MLNMNYIKDKRIIAGKDDFFYYSEICLFFRTYMSYSMTKPQASSSFLKNKDTWLNFLLFLCSVNKITKLELPPFKYKKILQGKIHVF
jgi:hypothetical protein